MLLLLFAFSCWRWCYLYCVHPPTTQSPSLAVLVTASTHTLQFSLLVDELRSSQSAVVYFRVSTNARVCEFGFNLTTTATKIAKNKLCARSYFTITTITTITNITRAILCKSTSPTPSVLLSVVARFRFRQRFRDFWFRCFFSKP